MRPHRYGLHQMERPFPCEDGHRHASLHDAQVCNELRERRMKREHPQLAQDLKPYPAEPPGEQLRLFDDLA